MDNYETFTVNITINDEFEIFYLTSGRKKDDYILSTLYDGHSQCKKTRNKMKNLGFKKGGRCKTFT